MENYKMDRTFVSKSSFKEADDHVTHYLNKSPHERLQDACFIINSIFGIKEFSKVDKTVTSSRKHAKSI